MRIASGKYKGRQLHAARDLSIRPTTNKIKEYIFGLLGERLDGARVLDLFCGSGGLGIEALSRGAVAATFVDISRNSLSILRRNLKAAGIEEPVQVFRRDVKSFLARNQQPFDLIFADPPFKWGNFAEVLPLVFKPENLCDEGIFVLESEKSHEINWQGEGFTLLRQKQFDRSIISFMTPERTA